MQMKVKNGSNVPSGTISVKTKNWFYDRYSLTQKPLDFRGDVHRNNGKENDKFDKILRYCCLIIYYPDIALLRIFISLSLASKAGFILK